MDAAPAMLVAEDDEELREVLIDLLREDGVVVEGACDGEDALTRFESGRYDVVLSDVEMPRLDGVGLLERLHDRQPGLPVILMTAFASRDHVRQALARGASDCLSKPFSRAALLEAVHRALAGGRPGPGTSPAEDAPG